MNIDRAMNDISYSLYGKIKSVLRGGDCLVAGLEESPGVVWVAVAYEYRCKKETDRECKGADRETKACLFGKALNALRAQDVNDMRV